MGHHQSSDTEFIVSPVIVTTVLPELVLFVLYNYQVDWWSNPWQWFGEESDNPSQVYCKGSVEIETR